MVSPARIRTNNLLAKAFNLNDFLDPTRLAHDELQYYNDLTRTFDKIISHYIDWLDSPEAKKLFYEEIQNREEYFQAIDQDLDDIIQDTSLSADRIIEKVYRKGLNYGYKDINRLPVFNDTCKYGLKATQEYNFELIRNVSNDLKDSIRHHIFRGIAEGQSIHEVARAITDSSLKPLEGKTLSAYQRASLIARTEIARSMTTGRLQSYANYGVEKVKILTAGDDNVCPICLKAAHKFNGEMSIENVSGDKLYTLEEASDLVPFHPACRCSVIAYIEHYQDIPQKPVENPYVADLTPMAHTDNAPARIKPTNDPVVSISKDRICNSLKRIVESKDELKAILNLLDGDFRFKVKDNSYEWGAGIGNNWEYQTTYKGKRNITPLSKILLNAKNKKGLLCFVHSHPVTTSPLASWEDYRLFAENKIKYSIITNEFGMMIIKNKNVEKSFDNASQIYKISSNIQRDLSDDFQEHIDYLDRTTNQKWLSDDEYDEKFHDFAKQNHDYYFDKYQSSLEEYFDITFIKPEGLIY